MTRPDVNDTPDVRHLLGHFATGVTIITIRDRSGTCQGMTASAVTSVSLEPPLLLVCIGQESRMHGALVPGAPFAVNILAAGQVELSTRFAAGLEDPFDGVECLPADGGPPLLAGAVAHILCDVWTERVAGDHTVFFGRIVGGETFPHAPLLHYRGRYATVRTPAGE